MSQEDVKAYLFNLIIFSQDKERTSYLRGLAHSAIAKFPCKIIIIQKEAENSELLRTQPLANEVFIEAGTPQLHIVPYLIMPHLVADLPIYLLWGEDPSSDHIVLPSLEKYATKLIFDSSGTSVSSLQHFAKDILQLMNSSNAEMMDLTWAKIAGWRDAIKTVFDTEDLINTLRNAHEVTVRFSAGPSSRLQAIYLQTWLASRLEWQFTEQQSGSAFSYNAKRHVVRLIEDPLSQSEIILSVDINSADQSFSFIKKEKASKLSVHISNEEMCKLPITLPFPDLKKSFVFMQEVFYQSANRHYRRMLETLQRQKNNFE